MITMDGKYQTRDGRAVRILCVDAELLAHPVVGLIIYGDGTSGVCEWALNGRYCSTSEEYPLDLIPVPTKHEGWISINTTYSLWSSKEECLKNELRDRSMPNDVVIAHVTWED